MTRLMIPRSYDSHHNDLETLTAFFTTARQIAGQDAGYLHAGDVLWRLTLNDVDRENDIRLWDDAMLGVVGVACFFTIEDFEFHLHPDLTDEQFFAIAAEMLEWAEQRYFELAQADEAEEPEGILTQATATNHRMQIALERAGFHRDPFEQLICLRDLNTPIPDGALPPGYTIRQVHEHEFEQRINLHQDVWQSEHFTSDRYDRVRALPGFIPELDLVVVAANGLMVAYCIVWLVDGVGEFEPVGTRTHYRQQGFGKAVVLEGLRRLQAMGAQTATVYSDAETRSFYQSCGFQIVNRWLGFVKRSFS
jgi:ribosomal protein S18 acetylase RimI-like enzyme